MVVSVIVSMRCSASHSCAIRIHRPLAGLPRTSPQADLVVLHARACAAQSTHRRSAWPPPQRAERTTGRSTEQLLPQPANEGGVLVAYPHHLSRVEEIELLLLPRALGLRRAPLLDQLRPVFAAPLAIDERCVAAQGLADDLDRNLVRHRLLVRPLEGLEPSKHRVILFVSHSHRLPSIHDMATGATRSCRCPRRHRRAGLSPQSAR